MMKRSILNTVACALAVLLVLPFTAAAQDAGTVEGTVTDAETETTIPGANVLLQPEDLGAVTGGQGHFEIADVPAGSYTLTVSFVGYEDYEQPITVGAGETVTADVALQPAVTQLETVSVTGYRLQEGEEVTGSTASINAKTIEEQGVQTAAEALQGRASGVRVTSQSGSPGSAFNIQVRGQGSINADDGPLYIVDGIQVSNEDQGGITSYSQLAGIDPQNIESVRVLKDAAASSIYGARAANGVVLITTKSGQPGDTRINFSSKVSAVTELNNDYGVLSSAEWGRYMRDAVNNTVGQDPWPVYAQKRGFPADPDKITGSDWYSAIRRTGVTQNYNLALSGGDEKTRFYLSGGFETLKGQYIAKDGKQYTLQAKLDHSITDDLQVGANVNLSTFSKTGDITGGIYINSPIYAPYFVPPRYNIYADPNDHSKGYNFNTGPFFNGPAVAKFNDRDFNSNQVIGNLSLSWTIAPWLTARSQGGVSFEDQARHTRRDERIPQYAPGSAVASSRRNLTLNLKQLLNYNFQIGDASDLSGLAGVEYRREYGQFTSAGGNNFPYFLLRRVASAAEPTSATQSATENRLLSFIGEAEYNYDERYIVRATGRLDGSSRFGVDNRYGLFGSGSAAWRLSEESFMDDVGFVDNLKLRASYGVLGNSNIGNFEATRLFGSPNLISSGAVDYANQPGLEPTSLGNVGLTWERSRELDLGLDYALFGNRISGSFNVYNKVTDQLLLDRDLPSDSGFFTTIQNAGKIRNRGLEIDLNTVNVNAGDFRWSTNFNISFQGSEVLEVPDDSLLINSAQGGGAYYKEGEPLARYRYTEAAGVNPADGRFMYRDADGNLTYHLPPGTDAEQYFGNALADFYGGLGNSFSYKGLTLSGFFQFDYGRVADNTDLSFQDAWNNYNKSRRVLDRWQKPGDVTNTPAPALGGVPYPGNDPDYFYFQNSSYTLEDASYIRLKQLRLDYELPATLLENLGMQNASIFVQGRNLWTITDYTGFDPELVGGQQLGEYPQNTTYTAGLNVTF